VKVDCIELSDYEIESIGDNDFVTLLELPQIVIDLNTGQIIFQLSWLSCTLDLSNIGRSHKQINVSIDDCAPTSREFSRGKVSVFTPQCLEGFNNIQKST
jgi:hypothetical protein